MFKTILLVSVILVSYLGYHVHQALYAVPPLPNISKDKWWGPGNAPENVDSSLKPFKIRYNSEKLKILKLRLNDTHWYTEPLEGIGFQYGFNGNYLKKVVEFWKTEYDFSARMEKLNRYPQFKTKIQGLDIHYVQYSQPNPKKLKVIPLLLIYAWPIINHKIIDELTNHGKELDFVFNIVAPSLPGFGYSQGASKPGLGVAQMSAMMDTLMDRLGHDKYLVHGGDWGAEVGATIATLYQDKVYGLHTNLAQASSPVSILKHLLFSIYPSFFMDEKQMSKLYPLSSFFSNLLEESGHVHLQITKPDTFGIAMQDSPVGLAVHFLEKFSTWSDKRWSVLEDGGLSANFDLADLLDNVMIHWDSGCVTTSMRIYSETFNKKHMDLKLDRIPVTVPTAIARCGQDYFFFSDSQLSEKFHNIIRLTDFENAGHFAGFQHPKMIANDVLQSTIEIMRI